MGAGAHVPEASPKGLEGRCMAHYGTWEAGVGATEGVTADSRAPKPGCKELARYSRCCDEPLKCCKQAVAVQVGRGNASKISKIKENC